jgi:hypothetical protein
MLTLRMTLPSNNVSLDNVITPSSRDTLFEGKVTHRRGHSNALSMRLAYLTARQEFPKEARGLGVDVVHVCRAT